MKKIVQSFTIYDLVLITLLSTLGLSLKPIINPIIKILNSTLLIPGGAMAGGIYMLWIVLAKQLISKPYVGFIVGFLQALIVLVIGISGSHGILSLLTYSIPGYCVDIIYLLKDQLSVKSVMFFSCLGANTIGIILTSSLFFKLPLIPFLLSICAAALSGGIGGLISYSIFNKLKILQIT